MTMETLLFVYYRIVIDASGLGGASPADGFIDHQNPESFNSFPSTLADSEKKERANMRWESILRQTSTTISPVFVQGIVATGSDEDTDATEFSFTLGYDREEYFKTEDEENLGTFLVDEAAIKRWVARALVQDELENRFFYNPTLIGSPARPQGPSIRELTAGKLTADLSTAESKITVTLIDLES